MLMKLCLCRSERRLSWSSSAQGSHSSWLPLGPPRQRALRRRSASARLCTSACRTLTQGPQCFGREASGLLAPPVELFCAIPSRCGSCAVSLSSQYFAHQSPFALRMIHRRIYHVFCAHQPHLIRATSSHLCRALQYLFLCKFGI